MDHLIGESIYFFYLHSIFTYSKENNIIVQVIIRVIAFSFYLIWFFFKNIKKSCGDHFEN